MTSLFCLLKLTLNKTFLAISLMAPRKSLKNLFRRKAAALFFWESAALALFFHDQISSLPFFVIPGLIILAGLVLFLIFYLYAEILAKRTRDHSSFFLAPLTISASPLLLFFLLIISRFVFLGDFRRPLLILVLSGIIFLQILFWLQLKRKYPGSFFRGRLREAAPWESVKVRNLSFCVFSIALLVYGVLASGLVFPSHPITGDEPHYLIITKSLLYDGDIDLANNYQNRDYLDFYDGILDAHTRPGKSGGRYSRHAPGLPIMLTPAYFLGDKAGLAISRLAENPGLHGQILVVSVRSGMSILAALLGLIFFRLMLALSRDKKVSLLAWLAFGFTPPILLYSQLIYPEIPAALICLAVFARVIRDQDDRNGPLFLLALGIGLLPWLGIKYAILALAAWLALAMSVWLRRRFRVATIAALVLPVAVSGLSFLYYLWHLYGSLSPRSMYVGTLAHKTPPIATFFHIRFSEAIRCGLGYLLDQRVGVFTYAPVYMIALAGAILLFKKNKKAALFLLMFFVPYWVFCSLTYYWGGFCPPGRTLLPVLWVFAFFVGSAIAAARSGFSFFIIRGLLFLSILIGIVGSLNPRLLYHDNLSFFLSEKGVTSNLLASLSNSFVDLTRFAPHLVNQETIFKAPLILWLGLILLLTLALIKKSPAGVPPASHPRLILPSVLYGIISLLCLLYVFFNARLEKPHVFEERQFSLYFQDDRAFAPEQEGFWTRGRARAAVFLESPHPAANLALNLSSPVPAKAVVSVGKDKRAISLSRSEGLEQTAVFPGPVGFPWKGRYLYAVRVRSENGFYPSRLDKASSDGRFLGVFVRIKVNQKIS